MSHCRTSCGVPCHARTRSLFDTPHPGIRCVLKQAARGFQGVSGSFD
jgi:hypothetical protein